MFSLNFLGKTPSGLIRGNYRKYSDTDRFKIGKYASEHSVRASVKKYKKMGGLRYSTVRNFRSKYEEALALVRRENGEPAVIRSTKSKERPKPIICEFLLFVS